MMNTELPNEKQADNVVGNEVDVRFVSVGNRTAKGKVDTGATTSCIHATDIRLGRNMEKYTQTVSFKSPVLSENIITMDLEGGQDVRSADGGDASRPLVKFDVEVNGVPIQGATFNLNDRSDMDSMVLIGQNILKAGNFQVDVNKDEAPERVEQVQSEDEKIKDEIVAESLAQLLKNNPTIKELVEFFVRSGIVKL